MKKLIAIAVLGLALAGCQTVKTDIQTIKNGFTALTSSTVSPTAIIVAANAFDAAEATATNYLKQVKCSGANGPLCRDPAVTAKLVPAIRAGRVARNNAEQFLIDHPGQLGTQGLLDAITVATSTITGALAQYK